MHKKFNAKYKSRAECTGCEKVDENFLEKSAFFEIKQRKNACDDACRKAERKANRLRFRVCAEIQRRHLKMRFANDVGVLEDEYLRALT